MYYGIASTLHIPDQLVHCLSGGTGEGRYFIVSPLFNGLFREVPDRNDKISLDKTQIGITIIRLTEHVNLKAIGVTFVRDIGNMPAVASGMRLSHHNNRTA